MTTSCCNKKASRPSIKFVDQWGNATYEIVKKLTSVPGNKICELPKPGEEYDESHPIIPQSGASEHVIPTSLDRNRYGERTETMTDDFLTTWLACHRKKQSKNKPNESVVYNLWGVAVRMLHPVLVEIAPTSSEHDPLNLVLGGRGQEPVKHI